MNDGIRQVPYSQFPLQRTTNILAQSILVEVDDLSINQTINHQQIIK